MPIQERIQRGPGLDPTSVAFRSAKEAFFRGAKGDTCLRNGTVGSNGYPCGSYALPGENKGGRGCEESEGRLW